jgi:uncharacterized protein YkwD
MKKLVAIGLVALVPVTASTAHLVGHGSPNQRRPHTLVDAAHRVRHHGKHHRRHHQHRFHTTIAWGTPRQATAAPAPAPAAQSAPAASAAAQSTAAASAAAQSAAAAPAPGAPCPNADTPATSAPAPVIDAAVVCVVNQERTSRGLPPLTENTRLDSSAQSWSDWLVANDQFTHGDNFAGRISATGYQWQNAGENIAAGMDTPQDAVSALMGSQGHCENILDPAFRDVGIGVNTTPLGLVGQGSTWTQDFGLQQGATAPSTNTGPMNGCPYNS